MLAVESKPMQEIPKPSYPVAIIQNIIGRANTLYALIRSRFLMLFHRLPTPLQGFLVRHRWKVSIGMTLFLLLAYGYHTITQEPEPEIITAEIQRGDLVQTVEAVGTIISERDLKLQFPISGVVQSVLVKEGDTVIAGQKLAQLRASDLIANVQSALASLQGAQAELAELREGTRLEDIAVSEAELTNKEAQLASARETLISSESKLTILEQEASVSVAGLVGESQSIASKQLTAARTALSVFDDVMADADVIDAFLRGSAGTDRLLKEQRNRADSIIVSILHSGFSFQGSSDALSGLRKVREAVALTASTMEDLFFNLSHLPPTGSFTRTEREDRKTDVSTQKTNVQTALAAVDTALKNLQDATAAYNTKIAAEQTTITNAKGDILNLETDIRTETARLALKKAGARPTEIQASAARVRAAQADYDRAIADFGDTILIAPVAGSITKVSIKEGELLSTAYQQDPAITMLGESPYRIEIYASEIDIPKVQRTQTGSIELDAFPGRSFSLTVAEVDPAATDIDGVPKYRIKLDFLQMDPGIKIGMTGDVAIVTGSADDVLIVPARAVYENDFGDTYIRILLKNGALEERRIEAGLEGQNDVEIMKGVAEGEVVVVLMKQ